MDETERRGGQSPDDGPLPQFQADHDFAQRTASGDPTARQEFVRQYGGNMYETAYQWCRRCCRRGYFCPLRLREWTRFLDDFRLFDCDEIQESYAFILDQILNHRLALYRGRASLKSYLFNFLSPKGKAFHSMQSDYIRHIRKRPQEPLWVLALNDFDQRVYGLSVRYRDEMRVAQELRTQDLDTIRESRRHIEDAARADNPRTLQAWLVAVYGGVSPLDARSPSEADVPTVDQIIAGSEPTPFEDADRCQRLGLLRRAISKLPWQDQVLVRLRCQEVLTLADIAERLGLKYSALHRRFRRVVRQLQVNIKEISPLYQEVDDDDLIDALESLLSESDTPEHEAGAAEASREPEPRKLRESHPSK